MPVAQVANATGIAQHRLVAWPFPPLRAVWRLAVPAGAVTLCWGVLASLVAAAADRLHLGQCCLDLFQAGMVVQDGTVTMTGVNKEVWLLLSTTLRLELRWGVCRKIKPFLVNSNAGKDLTTLDRTICASDHFVIGVKVKSIVEHVRHT